MSEDELKLALKHAKRDERHLSNAETRYWCDQYKLLATQAIEALAQQDSKDKEQAKTDSFVRQLDEALAKPEPWEKFCDSNCVWTDHHPDCKLAEPKQEPCCYGGIAHDCHAGKGCRIVKRMKVTQKPPQRKPLTDEEAQQIFAKHNCTISTHLAGILARAIEAAHNIKE